MSVFDNKYVRLAGRALLSGALAAGAIIYASNENVDKTVLLAAAVAGVHAFAEVFTPLNAVVGVFKKGDKVDVSAVIASVQALLDQKQEIDNVLIDIRHKVPAGAPDA